MAMLLLSPFITWLIMWIIGGSIFGFATNAIIRNKGYQENWFWWGFFFGFIAMLVAMSKPERVKPQRTQTDSWSSAGERVSQQEQNTYQNSGNNFNTIVDNTPLEKGDKSENDKEKDVLTIPIVQYNHAPKLKPCSLTCRPHHGLYAFVIKLKCFREKEITDVMMDIALHTTFGEIFTIKNIGFTNFEGTKYSRVSGMTEYPLPQAQFILIKQADIIIKKYVEGGKMVELSEEEMELKPYEEPLEEELGNTYVEEVILEVEKLKNSAQIYEYLLKYNAENNNVLKEGLLEIVKKQMYIERLYGTTKDTCIREIKTYFEENGI